MANDPTASAPISVSRSPACKACGSAHGDKTLARLLAPQETCDFAGAADKGRFLGKRFVAKEGFSKALGNGVRPPALLPAIAIDHDELGKPRLVFCDELTG